MHALSAAALAACATLALAGGFAAPAAAAPQALGVMASADPVPLVCAGSECRAEVTAFCLQESRPVPPEGTDYRAIGTAPMRIVLQRADGSTLALNASEHARLSSR